MLSRAPLSDDLEPWEIVAVRVVVDAFLGDRQRIGINGREDLVWMCVKHWSLAREKYSGRNGAKKRTFLGRS